MAKTTGNLQLTKPAYSDAADIAVINSNMDTIDSHVTALETLTSTHTSQISSLQDSVTTLTYSKLSSSFGGFAANLTASQILEEMTKQKLYIWSEWSGTSHSPASLSGFWSYMAVIPATDSPTYGLMFAFFNATTGQRIWSFNKNGNVWKELSFK